VQQRSFHLPVSVHQVTLEQHVKILTHALTTNARMEQLQPLQAILVHACVLTAIQDLPVSHTTTHARITHV